MSRVTLLLSCFLFSLPNGVLAESLPPPCWVGTPWPASGGIPFDQPAFVVPGFSTFADDPSFELIATAEDGETSTLATTVMRRDDAFVIAPTAALPVGTSLELRGDVCPSFPSLGEVSVLYRVLETAAAPPAPPLRLVPRVTGYASGGYYWGFRGEVTLHVDGGGVLAAWVPWVVPEVQIGSALTSTWVVERHALGSVALACEGFEGIAPGFHDATGRLRTIDDELLGVVEERVALDCDAARFVELGSERELSPEEVAALRRRPPDAGMEVVDGGSFADAGRFPDAGFDAGVRDAGVDDSSGSGGCRASGAGTVGGGWLIAGSFVRRRRRSSHA